MYYIIHTQHLEKTGDFIYWDCGVFDDKPQFRWKAKGGDIYVLYYNNVKNSTERMLNNFIAEECVRHSSGFCTYPIGKVIDVPSHNSYVYKWVAEEIDHPWFKFVYVTAPYKWEIQSVELDQEMWFSDDEGYAKVVLADKIKELTHGRTSETN